jgi:ParB-like chromosome segregation protein Spo0J
MTKKAQSNPSTAANNKASVTGGPDLELPWRIEMMPVEQMRPSKRNARTHSKKQISKIAHSIKVFGVVAPIVIDKGGYIIIGEGRNRAAKLLGLKHYPVIRLNHLNEHELRALALADNRLASEAGWDRKALAAEFGELLIELPALNLDLEITGFEAGEIDSIITDFEESQPDPCDDIPEADNTAAVAQSGDVFVLGDHRLLVADARDQKSYDRLLRGQTAQMAFLDPPLL